MPFACNARYFLITYAQCGTLCEWAVLDRFTELGAECIIARELHADLGIHLHCFIDFGRKFRSRKTDVFDVDGRHPNIQASRGTPEKGYDYAIKDGEVVAGGLERPNRATASGKTIDLWAQIAGAENRAEFWELCEELDPKSLCCSFSQLQKFCDWRFAEEPPVYRSPAGFGFVAGDVDGRDDWVSSAGLGLGQTQLEGECTAALNRGGQIGAEAPAPGIGCLFMFLLLTRAGRPLSLVLYGRTRTGKTLWARSLGSHIYNVGLVSGAECMKATDVKYAVFDDIRGGIKFFPAFKEWLGGQPWVSVKCLYRDPTLIKWGKPSIWISNDDPREVMERSDISWLEENAVFINIEEPIFHANTE